MSNLPGVSFSSIPEHPALQCFAILVWSVGITQMRIRLYFAALFHLRGRSFMHQIIPASAGVCTRSAARLISACPHYPLYICVFIRGIGSEKVGGSRVVLLSYQQGNEKILSYPTSARLWSHTRIGGRAAHRCSGGTGEAVWTKDEWIEQKTSSAGNWVALGQWIYHTFSLQTAPLNGFGKSLKLHYIWVQDTTPAISWAKFNEPRRITYNSLL